jgi:hypothetical protein
MDAKARVCLALAAAGCAAVLGLVLAPSARAQVGGAAQAGSANADIPIQPPPVATGREDVFQKPGTAQDAMIVGDWLLYPSAFAGVSYDGNVDQTASGAPGAMSSPGLRVSPNLRAETQNGLSTTTLYGSADGRFYFNDIPNGGGDIISARAGALEIYSPLPDVTLNGQADYTRQRDLFSSLGTDQTLVSLNPTGIGLSPSANPETYNQFSGAASVQKNFAQSFITLGGSIVALDYETTAGGAAASPNGTTYTGDLKGGYWITPALYGYLEGSLDSRDYATATLSSSGYRAIAGLGTDQIGLVKGELFAGYQSEAYRSSAIGTVGGPVYGLAGHYYPLPELTINVGINESLGASLLAATPTSPAGTASKVDTYLATANYSLSREWSASARGGYIHTNYVGTGRRDDAWTTGGTITYNFLRNLGLTLDYQHYDVTSNVALQGFTRDVVALGATWRY